MQGGYRLHASATRSKYGLMPTFSAHNDVEREVLVFMHSHGVAHR